VELVNKELLASLINGEELYQNAPCGYFSFLPNGTIIKVNRTLLQWLGYAEEEVLFKKKFIDIITKGSAIYYEMFYMTSLKMHGHLNEINFEIIRKDGSIFPALINSAVISDVSGNQQAINATLFDITDRKKYERELLLAKKEAEAEKKRFEFLSDLIPEIIWTASAEGEIDYANNRFYEYFDCAIADLNARFLISKVHANDRAKCFRAWIRCINTGEGFECQVRLKNCSNRFEWHLLRATAYRETEGHIVKWFGSCTNIDDQVIASQRKDEFISIASHELKTPITSLKLYNQLLQRTESSEKVKGFIDKSAATLSNLQFLVSSLLDVSQINSGQLTLELSSTRLTTVLKHSVELTKANYPTHQILVEFDKDAEIFVKADSQRITQVIINLLSNAIKYSPQADKVILRVSKNDEVVKVEVIDFGLGIPAEKLDFIFEKYYRVSDTSNSNRITGLGLGLYIIQNIVKLHGSRIYVKSEVGIGSTFYFSLPLTTH
jgi:PAS domain S-box-containing protein